MSVSEGLPSAEASESNEATIKKRRVTKKNVYDDLFDFIFSGQVGYETKRYEIY